MGRQKSISTTRMLDWWNSSKSGFFAASGLLALWLLMAPLDLFHLRSADINRSHLVVHFWSRLFLSAFNVAPRPFLWPPTVAEVNEDCPSHLQTLNLVFVGSGKPREILSGDNLALVFGCFRQTPHVASESKLLPTRPFDIGLLSM